MRVSVAQLNEHGANTSSSYLMNFMRACEYKWTGAPGLVGLYDTDVMLKQMRNRIENYKKSIRFAQKVYDVMIKKYDDMCLAIQKLEKGMGEDG